MTDGGWAAPLRATKHHFFRDGDASSVCGAYLVRDVKPSEFGTTTGDPRWCPICAQELGYVLPSANSNSESK